MASPDSCSKFSHGGDQADAPVADGHARRLAACRMAGILQELGQRVESLPAGPGVYLFHEDYTVESFSYDSPSTGSPQNGYLRSRQKNDAYAVFGAVWFALKSWRKKAIARITMHAIANA